MSRTEKIRIAFFKGNNHEFHHRFIRWWTKSQYSHTEIVLDNDMWISISPFLYARVAARVRTSVNTEEWDYLDFHLTAGEFQVLKNFISETTGDGYDWIGMLISQLVPFIVKGKGKWYCSQWVFAALSYAGVVKSRSTKILETPDLSPGKLYEILSQVADLPIEDTAEKAKLL